MVIEWKWVGVIAAVVFNIVSAGTAVACYNGWADTENELEQANTVIKAKIEELQSFNSKLGIADSTLLRHQDLIEKYEEEVEHLDEDFLELVEKHDLELKSRDRTITGLKGRETGGRTTVTTGNFETIININEVCDGKQIAYEWQDKTHRFHLKDPDIAIPNNEVFDYQQWVAIKGFVFTDATGNIQVKKLEIQEVIRNINEEGEVTYDIIPGGKVTIADSKFEYTNKSPKEESWSWFDPITLRPVALFDVVSLQPGLGLELFNLGKWFPLVNIGLVPKVSLDTTLNMSNSRMGIGAVYHFLPPLVDTNLALGVGVTTPFNDIGRMMLSVDLIFYLTNDLF
jgi:hypothetical protein